MFPFQEGLERGGRHVALPSNAQRCKPASLTHPADSLPGGIRDAGLTELLCGLIFRQKRSSHRSGLPDEVVDKSSRIGLKLYYFWILAGLAPRRYHKNITAIRSVYED